MICMRTHRTMCSFFRSPDSFSHSTRSWPGYIWFKNRNSDNNGCLCLLNTCHVLRHCPEHLTCISSCISSTTTRGRFSNPLRLGHSSTDRLSDLLMVSQLVSGGAGIQRQAVWRQGTLDQYMGLLSVSRIIVSPRNPKGGILMSLAKTKFLSWWDGRSIESGRDKNQAFGKKRVLSGKVFPHTVLAPSWASLGPSVQHFADLPVTRWGLWELCECVKGSSMKRPTVCCRTDYMLYI